MFEHHNIRNAIDETILSRWDFNWRSEAHQHPRTKNSERLPQIITPVQRLEKRGAAQLLRSYFTQVEGAILLRVGFVKIPQATQYEKQCISIT